REGGTSAQRETEPFTSTDHVSLRSLVCGPCSAGTCHGRTHVATADGTVPARVIPGDGLQDSRGTPAFRWAVPGLVLILGSAVHRLGRRGIEAMDGGLTPSEWLALVLLTATFVVREGYYAIARKSVPRVLGRAAALRTEPRLAPRLLAPLHAMG